MTNWRQRSGVLAVGSVVLALLLPLGAVGCGEGSRSGGESSGPATTSEGSEPVPDSRPAALPKEFISQSAKVCGRAGQRIIESISSAVPRPGEDAATAFTSFSREVLIPTVEDELAELEALEPPAAAQTNVDHVLDMMRAGIAAAQRASLSSLTDFGRSFQKFDRLAQANGMDACAFGLF